MSAPADQLRRLFIYDHARVLGSIDRPCASISDNDTSAMAIAMGRLLVFLFCFLLRPINGASPNAAPGGS